MNKNNIVLIVGATGAIGSAISEELKKEGFSDIIKLSRYTEPKIDLTNEKSICDASFFIQKTGKEIALLFDATGILHLEKSNILPEKTYKNIDLSFMKKNFEINAYGPALLMKYFLPLLDTKNKSIFVTLSAKVGSIQDNRYGGWYSYRASKAALNQLVKTASIEIKMKNKQAICISMHPGTVDSNLSKPFQKNGLKIQSPKESARNMLKVISKLTSEDTGNFFNWNGDLIPW